MSWLASPTACLTVSNFGTTYPLGAENSSERRATRKARFLSSPTGTDLASGVCEYKTASAGISTQASDLFSAPGYPVRHRATLLKRGSEQWKQNAPSHWVSVPCMHRTASAAPLRASTRFLACSSRRVTNGLSSPRRHRFGSCCNRFASIWKKQTSCSIRAANAQSDGVGAWLWPRTTVSQSNRRGARP